MFDPIETALEDLAQGKVIIVTDDEDRENEGDFVMIAEKVTSESINFMSKFGRGLICSPISQKRAEELNLSLMVANDVASKDKESQASFTVSIDSIFGGSGISSSDRALTIQALTTDITRPEHLKRPGHVFPLIANPNGIKERRGHTEAAVELARLTGHKEAAVLCEILDDDGETASYEHLKKLSKMFRLKIISINCIDNYLKLLDSKPQDQAYL